MTQAVAEVKLPWDSFLEKGLVQVRTSGNAVREDAIVQAIDGFRTVEWPHIKKELAKPPYSIMLAEGLEPHWVSPGRAVYWQRQTRRVIVVEKDDDGNSRRAVRWKEEGWAPTTDQGLPANNPSQIAHYLEKGLRLRPPQDGVEDEVVKASVPSEVLQRVEEQPAIEQRVFRCSRHREGRDYVLKTWKAYTRHCVRHSEPIELQPPDKVVELMGKHPYFCMMHARGFKNKVGAQRHFRTEMRKPGRSVHQTVDQMDMARWGKEDAGKSGAVAQGA
jgi:hypothetical protein